MQMSNFYCRPGIAGGLSIGFIPPVNTERSKTYGEVSLLHSRQQSRILSLTKRLSIDTNILL